MKGMVGELFHFSGLRTPAPLLPLVTSLLGLGQIQAPTVEKTVLQTLPAYYTYLQGGGFSKYTPDDFTGDLKKFGVFQKDRPIKDGSCWIPGSWSGTL
jgi:hypothetical protein